MTAARKYRVPSDVRALPESDRPAAYAELVSDGGWQDSLEARISAGVPLSSDEIEKCVRLFGRQCQEQTKRALRDTLERVPNVRSYGIYQRVMLGSAAYGYGASYTAGQDYPSEIREIRKLLTLGR